MSSRFPPKCCLTSGLCADRSTAPSGAATEAGRRWSAVYVLPGGFRLLIGHDLGDRARIGAVMVRALAISLVFFAALGGGRRAVRRPAGAAAASTPSTPRRTASWPATSTRRLPVSGSGDELDRLAEGLNEMLGRIAELMQGLREVSDNIAHDLRTPLTRLRNHAEAALAFGGDAAAYRARAREDDRGIGRAHQDLQRAAADRARRGGRRRRPAADVRRRRSGAKRRRTLRADRRGGGRRADGRDRGRARRSGAIAS